MYKLAIEYYWQKTEFRFNTMTEACKMAEFALNYYVKDAEHADEEIRVVITKEEDSNAEGVR